MTGKKTIPAKHGGRRGGARTPGKKATPAKQGGRSRRERRQALAELKRQRALAESLRAGEKSRGVFASLKGLGEEAELPEWIDAEVAAAEAEASPGRLPLVMFRRKGKPAGDALVVMRLSEMQRHFSVSVKEPDGPAGEEGP